MKSIVITAILMLLLAFTFISKNPVADVCLNKEEQKLYELMMEYRKSKGLPAIPMSEKLTMVAQAHARDLADHYNIDDTKCNLHSWSKSGKWSACCYTSDHKQAQCMWEKPREIAGYNDYGFEIAFYTSRGATASEGLEGWKLSPGHNPLIVNQGMWSSINWKAIGIGFYGDFGVVWFGQIEDISNPKLCQ
jgi:uncharacterized protein YkwD